MQLGAMNDPKRSLLNEISFIAESGFDYIDLTIEAPGSATESTRWSDIASAIQEKNLGVVCHSAPYLPIENPSPLVRQAAFDELRRTIDAAQILGAELCTMHFMGWPTYMEEETGYELYRQLLAGLCKHGADRGVSVAMENGPEMPHQLKHFRQIFHRVPDLTLLFDVAHGNIAPSPSMLREYLSSLNERLRHIHMSDNDGISDLHLPFGAPMTGGIDLAGSLRTLRSFGYDGTITVEVFGERPWLLRSADRIREIWAEVG